MSSKKCKTRDCKGQEYKENYCIDCFRKFAQTKGKRPAVKKAKGANTETLTNLVSGINRQKKFGKMVKYSLQCVSKLATDEAAVEEILETGVVGAAMDALQSNAKDEEVCHSVNLVVLATCTNPSTTATVCKQMEGKFGCFVDSLNTHLDEDTLVSTCQSMAALSKDPKGRAGLAESGGIEAMAKCIREHPYNLDIIRAGASSLAEFAKDPKYAELLMSSGAMQLILDAMKRFPDDLELNESAAKLIATLAKTSPAIAAQLKAMGAIDALAEALERHPFSDVLTEYAGEALRYLAGESEIQSTLGMISTGVASRRPDKKMSKALARVGALCLVSTNVDYMHTHGGVQAVMAVMQGAMEDKSEAGVGVLVNGARTLARLAGDPKKSYAIMSAGGIRMITGMLQARGGDAKIAEAGISQLASVMDRKEHALYIGKVGGVEAALATLALHPNDPNVAKAVIKFIKGEAQYPEGLQMMIERGGVPALVQILRNHIANPEIAKSSLEALALFAETEHGRKALLAASALPLLVEAIVQHANNPDVIKASLRAILKALEDPSSADILKKAGVVQAILTALDNFPGDPELQALGQRVLRMLAESGEIKAAQVVVQEQRVKRDADDEKKQKQIVKDMDDDIARNMAIWENEMKKRKEGEAERLRAYEELKRREAEVLSMQNEKMKLELERRQALEDQQKLLREQQEMIERIKQEKKEKIKRKDEARREAFEREAWKKYEHVLNDKPDLDRLKAKAKLRALLNDEAVKAGEEEDEESDLF